ncbi:hypothetical protein [Luteimonas sp. R10]|uniref:hypothetical protein n=1 Tax=Luteimonas sp. R10 TaxID=3108176 RepID=UPI0030927F1C|nr:hypothetical protein U3649_03615 [Luteimonas sp. R10]
MTGIEIRRIFAVPALLALVSSVGLVSGLLGDGVWDAVSWIALGTVVVVAARAWWRR